MPESLFVQSWSLWGVIEEAKRRKEKKVRFLDLLDPCLGPTQDNCLVFPILVLTVSSFYLLSCAMWV